METIYIAIIALVSVCSPFATNIMNHRHELRLYEMKKNDSKNETIRVFFAELSAASQTDAFHFDGLSNDALAVVEYLPSDYIELLFHFLGDLRTFSKRFHEATTMSTCSQMTFTHSIYQKFLDENKGIYHFYEIVDVFVCYFRSAK